jgi:hypothetical protein
MQFARISVSAMVTLLGMADLANAGSAGRCGGTGGEHTKTLTCPNGQYIAGMAARGGLFVDEFSIACRKLPVDGSVGSLGNYISAGPGGGTKSASGECNRKHAVRRLLIKSGAFVDKIEFGKCGAREGDDEAWFGDRSSFELNIGGGGGGRCVVQCPNGEALYKVTVKYGGWIDSIRGECRR